ncbi:MAG: hypothetical protein K8I03_06940 [Ignavibacteria bacterium]|nr:hypothetical protein [Ignavibacteria bacterium]
MAKFTKTYDPLLNADIMQLKKLRRAPGKKTEYWALFEEIKAKHKIRNTTVYAEMRKDTPGTYKTNYRHSVNIPITEMEVRMVEELLARKMVISQLKRYMAFHLGIPYGIKRLMKVRKMIAANPSPPDAPSAFDDNIRSLFYNYAKLDLSDPSATHEVVLPGDGTCDTTHRVNSGVIRDSLDLIVYSASNGGRGTQDIHRIKMELLLTRRLNMVEQGLTITGAELKTIESVRKSLQSSPGGMGAEGFTPDFRVLYETVKYFAPDAGVPYILRAAMDIQEKIGGSTMDVKSYWKELMESVHKEMDENM